MAMDCKYKKSVKRGGELYDARGRDIAIPSFCSKFFSDYDLQQTSDNEERLGYFERQNLLDIVDEPIVMRSNLMTNGETCKDCRLVFLRKGRGKLPPHLGFMQAGSLFLNSEEALHFLNMGELSIDHGGVPLCLQSALSLLLESELSYTSWVIYSRLTCVGYRVVRYKLERAITRYEKEINLLQSSTSTNKKRKFSGCSNHSNDFPFKNGDIEVSEDKLSDELKLFYSEIEIIECDLSKSTPDGTPKEIMEVDIDSNSSSSDISSSSSLSFPSTKSVSTSSSMESIVSKISSHLSVSSSSASESSSNEYDYKTRKKLLIDQFPSFINQSYIEITAPGSELLPTGVNLQNSIYRIHINSFTTKKSFQEALYSKNLYYNNMGNNSPYIEAYSAGEMKNPNFGRQEINQSFNNYCQPEEIPIDNRINNLINRARSSWGEMVDDLSENTWCNRNGWSNPQNLNPSYSNPHNNFQERQNSSNFRPFNKFQSNCGSKGGGFNNFRSRDNWRDRSHPRKNWNERKGGGLRGRKFQREEEPTYPSYIIKSIASNSSSWDDYKHQLKTMKEDSFLSTGSMRALWSGKTKPLMKPSQSKSLGFVRSHCAVSPRLPSNERLTLLKSDEKSSSEPFFDVYLPGVDSLVTKTPDYRLILLSYSTYLNSAQMLYSSLQFGDEVPSYFSMLEEGQMRMFSFESVAAKADQS